MASARSIRVRGVVQGVGFRPFVFRLATRHALAGWVRNVGDGVQMHLEGADDALHAFCEELAQQPPPAAVLAATEIQPAIVEGLRAFEIRASQSQDGPASRIAPDLPVCDACLAELFDPRDRRHGYPYINCTHCGPRYSVILALPYDRASTTMKDWPLDAACAAEYDDPADRRFHAQPVACPACGPAYELREMPGSDASEGDALSGSELLSGSDASIRRACTLLRDGRIVAVKGLGGYHLACDADNAAAVTALRERKFRKDKPFAVMVADLPAARQLIEVTPAVEALLTATARPIVLARARTVLPGVAPDHDELGVMLPYTPLHHLLFARGAPARLVMTSANRSSEPIAYEDRDALDTLSGIADAFLIGQRPIARRVEDSVARVGPLGPVLLRRSRGYAPGIVCSLPVTRPVLAVGADLKNTITLVVDGQAIVSQHIGDLDHYSSRRAFDETLRDLVAMYRVRWNALLVVHDAHPEYASTMVGRDLPVAAVRGVQHHRAHIASVLAERGAWDERVLGISLDGTGYGDDGGIWGGEFFAGSVSTALARVAHLRPAALAGGDAAARHPVQAAAGFLAQLEELPDLTRAPFSFPPRYHQAQRLVASGVRTWKTTSMGRLFDAAAALLGFTEPVTYEGQAAMWLERLARAAQPGAEYDFPFEADQLDFRPLLRAIIADRLRGRAVTASARDFQRGVAQGLCRAAIALCRREDIGTIVCSGGVFQNQLLLEDMTLPLRAARLRVWTNQIVPPNDGGISLGQAALGIFAGDESCTNSPSR